MGYMRTQGLTAVTSLDVLGLSPAAPITVSNFKDRCCAGPFFNILDSDCGAWQSANPQYFMGSGWGKCGGAFDPSLVPPALRSAPGVPPMDESGRVSIDY